MGLHRKVVLSYGGDLQLLRFGELYFKWSKDTIIHVLYSGWRTHHRHHEQISRMFMNNSNLSDQAAVIVVELERTAMMY